MFSKGNFTFQNKCNGLSRYSEWAPTIVFRHSPTKGRVKMSAT